VKVYVNGKPREVAADATLLEVLGLGADLPARGVAVAIDGDVVPRAELPRAELHDGVRIEVVTAVQGG
jgi:sulfur carrier protein